MKNLSAYLSITAAILLSGCNMGHQIAVGDIYYYDNPFDSTSCAKVLELRKNFIGKTYVKYEDRYGFHVDSENVFLYGMHLKGSSDIEPCNL